MNIKLVKFRVTTSNKKVYDFNSYLEALMFSKNIKKSVKIEEINEEKR
mgnify:CR=1 FL=1